MNILYIILLAPSALLIIGLIYGIVQTFRERNKETLPFDPDDLP